MSFATKLHIVYERLSGMGHYTALEAFEFARRIHTGTRKDKVTPEFQHQTEILLYLFTLHGHIEDFETTVILTILHDTPEDNWHVTFDELTARFGQARSDGVRVLTKVYRGEKVPIDQYYAAISNHREASMVKGADRTQNIGSMVDVFTIEKQKEYLDETERWTLPMIKDARFVFPRQRMVYENEKHLLKTQIRLIRSIHAALTTTPSHAMEA